MSILCDLNEKYFFNPLTFCVCWLKSTTVNSPFIDIAWLLSFKGISGLIIFRINICFCCLHLEFPFSWKKSQLSSDDFQGDQPGEQKDHSKKDRKGKKNKKKRDKGSKGKGKGKRKGKGRKGSRNRKHEEESLQEEGFLSVSTTAPGYGPFQPTEVPHLKETLETTIPSGVFGDDFDQTLMGTPTLMPDYTTEAPTEVSSPLPETKTSDEVVTFRDHNPSLPVTSPNHRDHLFPITPTTN